MRCEQCNFYRPMPGAVAEEKAAGGRCHFDPPKLFLVPGPPSVKAPQGTITVQSFWPMVKPDDFCAHFAVRPGG